MKLDVKKWIAKITPTRTTPEYGLPASGTFAYTANCFQICGLKIQWGVASCINGQHHTITFKVPFTNIGYAAFASYTNDSDTQILQPTATITGQHTDYCRIYTGGGRYAWLCIGY